MKRNTIQTTLLALALAAIVALIFSSLTGCSDFLGRNPGSPVAPAAEVGDGERARP